MSLYAKGMTTGDIANHLADVYGTEVSRDLVSRLADAVVEQMQQWQSRPLDAGRIPAVVANRAGRRTSCLDTRRTRCLRPPSDGISELIRDGMPGSEAARQVGVSTSCGSLWFIDVGSVRAFEPTPISRRFLSQDDRIEIADGLGRDEPVKSIAARIGKSYQAVYREIARNGKPDDSYQP